jgi:hypothetical protein
VFGYISLTANDERKTGMESIKPFPCENLSLSMLRANSYEETRPLSGGLKSLDLKTKVSNREMLHLSRH